MPNTQIAQSAHSNAKPFKYFKSETQLKGFKAYIYVQTKPNKLFSEPRYIDTFPTEQAALMASVNACNTTPNAISMQIIEINGALLRRDLVRAKGAGNAKSH